jgi:antitoxin (DNA-binding transcriptional repressor) of toxin-antitoxin stability system
MCHMRSVTVRDLHTKTSEIVKEVAGGEIFIIEKRGVAVAEIRPFSELPPTRRLPDREKSIRRLPRSKIDSGHILEEDRF